MANEKEKQVQVWNRIEFSMINLNILNHRIPKQTGSIRDVVWWFIQEINQIEKDDEINSLEQDGREGETPVISSIIIFEREIFLTKKVFKL